MRRRYVRVLLYGLAALMLVFTLFPFYWAVVTSLKTGTDLFRVEYWPASLEFGNYRAVFENQPFGRNILNSVLAASSTVVLALGLGVFAGYGLGCVRFRGRRTMLYAILAISMFPQIAVLSGLFEVINALGLYNRWAGLTFAYMIFTLPFSVWVLSTFARSVPREVEEMAYVDGASPWAVVTKVFLPLLGPGLVTTGLLAFVEAWNEFLFALTFTLTDEARTVPVAIALISGASEYELPWGRIMAASVIVTVPVVALALAFQRYIVAGLTAGALKG